jgi:hypothetical protein
VYSFHERRVVVRGQGHRSWVSVVSFDVQNLAYGDAPDGLDFSGSDDEMGVGGAAQLPAINSPSTAHRPLEGGAARQAVPAAGRGAVRGAGAVQEPPCPAAAVGPVVAGPSNPALASPPEGRALHPAAGSPAREAVTCYRLGVGVFVRFVIIFYLRRFGSVSQDTTICLWDLSEELLKQSAAWHRARAPAGGPAGEGPGKGRPGQGMSHSNSVTSKDSGLPDNGSSSNHRYGEGPGRGWSV